MSQTLSFPVPSAVGSLDQYIQTVNRIPMLSEQEESELARDFRDHENLEAARKLVLSHL
ncbi:MAG: sigma-70 factor domain-containing protein, partial [Zoogloea sp.]